MSDADKKILEDAQRSEEYLKERRKLAMRSYVGGLLDNLELLREEVAGIVANAQATLLERLRGNEQRWQAERADLLGKIEALSNRISELERRK